MTEPSSLSDELRAAREARGESIEQVHQQTGIAVTILQGLESGNFEIVEPVYARLAIDHYATYLGLDGRALEARLRAEVAASRPPDVTMVAGTTPPSGPIPTASPVHDLLQQPPARLAAIAVVVVVIIAVVLYLLSGDSPAPTSSRSRPPTPRAPTAQAPASQTPVPQRQVAQAPATQAPVAQAPATQAPVAQAPSVQTSGTQTPGSSSGVRRTSQAEPPTQAASPTQTAPPTQTPPSDPVQAEVDAVVAAPTEGEAIQAQAAATVQGAEADVGATDQAIDETVAAQAAVTAPVAAATDQANDETAGIQATSAPQGADPVALQDAPVADSSAATQAEPDEAPAAEPAASSDPEAAPAPTASADAVSSDEPVSQSTASDTQSAQTAGAQQVDQQADDQQTGGQQLAAEAPVDVAQDSAAQITSTDDVEIATPQAEPALGSMVLEVEALDSTWVQIQWDDDDGIVETIPSGERRSFFADREFLVRAGRAHGVHFHFQGQLLGGGRLGDPTKVLRFRATSTGVELLGPDLEPIAQVSPDSTETPSRDRP